MFKYKSLLTLTSKSNLDDYVSSKYSVVLNFHTLIIIFFTNKDDLNVYVGISVLLVPEVRGTSVEGYIGLI